VKFCGECGARLESLCPTCQAANPLTNKFCHQCGGPLTGATRIPKAPSPESYTPKHLAERILTSKSALEGERKQVTVLFADLKGSMELLADRDPEEARKILDPVLELMMEAVHRYEGTVNQVMGDGIMALFGAPLAHEDHAVRACYAALRMQASVKRYAEGVRRQEGITVRIRVGLNSGEVVVRAIGSDLHMDYTAVGQTTHLAARMEQLADPTTVLLTPATLALAEDFIQVRPLGPTPVKGLSEPVEVYELVGANPVRSRFEAHAARGLTAFVGRASEMAQLVEALDLARDGRGQVVAVVGEPGVGKSRLFWEFGHSHRTAGCLLLESASVSYGKATTYLPVVELLRGYFQIEARDDIRKVRERVTGKLLSLDRALEPAIPPLFSLLDVTIEDDEWTRLDPAQRRQRTLGTLKRLLLRESQVQPLIVVFEDLHWIDSETQAVLDGLVESLPTARILLLLNYRPEYAHGWGSKMYYRQVRLDTLPEATAVEFLKALFGTDRQFDELGRRLIERTQGNPFFLEESVRALVETGALTGARGAYRLAGHVQSLELPATAQAILAARIDRLAPSDKRLLQTASVIGKDFPYSLLDAIADMDESVLRAGLARLQAAEFLYEVRLFPDLEYTFKHALTYEVAYASLLVERRRAVHGQIVEAVERLAGNRVLEQVEQLAHHAFRAGHWIEAIKYLRLAAERAATRSAHQEAVRYLEQTLEALGHLPQTPEAIEQGVDVRLLLRTSLFPLLQLDRVHAVLLEAERSSEMLGDQRRLAEVLSYLAHYCWATGAPGHGVALSERVLSMDIAKTDIKLRARASWSLGSSLHAMGDYRKAAERLREVIASLQGDLLRDRLGMSGYPSVFARTWLALALADVGEFGDARACSEEAFRIAAEPEQLYSTFHAYFGQGFVELITGNWPAASRRLEQAETLARAGDLRTMWVSAAGFLGGARAGERDLAEGISLLEEAVTQSAAMGWMRFQARHLALLAAAYLAAGRPVDANRVAGESLELARGHGQRGDEAYALFALAEIGADREQPDSSEAQGHYVEGLAVAEALGMRPLVAHCHLGLGKLYRRTGKREQTQEHLGIAATMYREMDMQFYLEQAEAEMGA
jgi:class 3 adenylate cyclase/tetratricopeptide (TPR) repeat protein